MGVESERKLIYFIEERGEGRGGRKGDGCFLHQWIGTNYE
jgi:hypothetical protein